MDNKSNTGSDLAVDSASTGYEFFAGWQYCDEWVSGGLGSTIEDALNDYLADHAESEMDYACLGDGDEFTVSIYSTINHNEAKRRGMDEEWDESWQYMIDKVVDKRTFSISIEEGEVSFIPHNNKSTNAEGNG